MYILSLDDSVEVVVEEVEQSFAEAIPTCKISLSNFLSSWPRSHRKT